jgi:hypothetical protein
MTRKYKENTYPMTLENTQSDLKNPYKVIEGFFSNATLDRSRKYISSMLKAAYSEDYWKKSDPGMLLFFQEQMEKLIKGSHLFVDMGKDGISMKRSAILKDNILGNEIDPSCYFGWHRDGAMWEFFPRNLTRKEFLNPYLAIQRFFEYKNLKNWLKDFKELISYSLSLYGNESGMDFDYLEIYKYLQKLVEACHLIEVRVNMPERGINQKVLAAAETKDESESLGDREEKSEDYSDDPYEIINRFFLDGTIEDGRDDINRLFEAAFPDEIVSKKHYPSLLVHIFERLDKLIDAAFSINKEWKDEENIGETNLDAQVIPQVKQLYKEVGDWKFFPFKLKPFEWINPRLVISAFFKHQPLSHWKGKLHEILQASIKDESICYLISDRSKLYWDCEHLERLIEAMWVIKVIDLS